jgi:hypothetical protein
MEFERSPVNRRWPDEIGFYIYVPIVGADREAPSWRRFRPAR